MRVGKKIELRVERRELREGIGSADEYKVLTVIPREGDVKNFVFLD